MSDEILNYDVIIVGGGPAGLAAAIKLKHLSPELTVCILEKGSEIGAHILSGVVIEPRALDELLPDWRNQGAPLEKATKDQFYFLTEKKAFQVPQWMLLKQLHNDGNYIGSLSQVCRWLAELAIGLNVEIYPGFAATKLLFHENGRIIGVQTGDMGIAKDGTHKPTYTAGVELHAKYTLFAEGARGFLSQQLIKHFHLDTDADPQTYGLGVKEVWEINPALHKPGLIQHTAGWPLNSKTYGGSFIYHFGTNLVSVGFVTGLDYQNPFLDPYEEMQRFKTHPLIKPLLHEGRRLSYGARVLNEGGYQSIPKLIFPGGALIGCAAGFLNVAKIKGSHNAMKSGIIAAEAIINALKLDPQGADELVEYPQRLQQSWVYEELYTVRNFRPVFHYGLWLGTLLGGIELKLLQGKTPWTLHHRRQDRYCTQKANIHQPIVYPKPDGVLTFDRTSSVFLANTQHDEDQPIHLHIKNPALIEKDYELYASPEQRYCPAGVYEILNNAQGKPYLQINAANCVHCKTCDIKDPLNNIEWRSPEGGSGPNYNNM